MSSSLPEGWNEYQTADGKTYFYDVNTRRTQWHRPTKESQPSSTVENGSSAPSPSSTENGSPFTPEFAAVDMVVHNSTITVSASTNDKETNKSSVFSNTLRDITTTDSSRKEDGREVSTQTSDSLLPGLMSGITDQYLTCQSTFGSKYFDVTSEQIMERLLLALLPYRLLSIDGQTPYCEKPDMYGPIWILVTTCFSIFASSHAYFWAGFETWETKYSLINVAFYATFLFWVICPIIVRIVSLTVNAPPSAFKFHLLLCVYGYALLPVIPVCLFCAVPWRITQIVSITLGLAISSMFVAANFLSDLLALHGKARFAVGGTIVVLQLIYFGTLPLYYIIRNFTQGSHSQLSNSS